VKLQILSRLGAFGTGSSLWIFPNLDQSAWTRLMDWHLNFQISKAHKHRSKGLGANLKKIIKSEELPSFYSLPKNAQALLISSQNQVPNIQTVELPSENDEKNWIQNAFNTWSNLGRPKLRVFLPPQIDHSDFNHLWPDNDEESDVTVVPDQALAGPPL